MLTIYHILTIYRKLQTVKTQECDTNDVITLSRNTVSELFFTKDYRAQLATMHFDPIELFE